MIDDADYPAFEFSLDAAQTKQFLAWRDDPAQHGKCKATEAKTAIGGAFSFTFTTTTIGTVVKASCCVCNTEIDLSDYDNW